jgi:hypothetical protein
MKGSCGSAAAGAAEGIGGGVSEGGAFTESALSFFGPNSAIGGEVGAGARGSSTTASLHSVGCPPSSPDAESDARDAPPTSASASSIPCRDAGMVEGGLRRALARGRSVVRGNDNRPPLRRGLGGALQRPLPDFGLLPRAFKRIPSKTVRSGLGSRHFRRVLL